VMPLLRGRDLADEAGGFDGGEQTHASFAARAPKDVDAEGASHEVGPSVAWLGLAGLGLAGLGPWGVLCTRGPGHVSCRGADAENRLLRGWRKVAAATPRHGGRHRVRRDDRIVFA
jgi:hypothetical protein